MRVEIPMLPPRELNPNFHGHWAKKAKATRDFKTAAFYCAQPHRGSVFRGSMFIKAEVSITFVIRDGRGYKDTDNALSALKPAIDGCVAAGLIFNDDDQHLRYKLPIMYEIDKDRAPMTILEFKEVK